MQVHILFCTCSHANVSTQFIKQLSAPLNIIGARIYKPQVIRNNISNFWDINQWKKYYLWNFIW